MSELLGYTQIVTTPYHPQGNGVVERLHGSLKPMLAKSKTNGVDWARLLPLTLFALRQVPNVDTGMSPCELISYMWVDDTYRSVDVSSWVVSLSDCLKLLHDECVLKNKVCKDRAREKMNKTQSTRVFKVGNRVLMKIPGMCGSLQDSWEGPYIVLTRRIIV